MTTVNFSKANSILTEIPANVRVRTDGGQENTVKPYKQKAMPNASHTVMPHFRLKGSQGRWLCTLSGDDLNRLVRECGLYDKEDNPILEARLNNIRDPFFNHESLKVTLENGTADIDDTTPIGRAQLSWMNASQAYVRKGKDKTTADKLMQRYELTDVKTEKAEAQKEQTEVSSGVKAWFQLDFEMKKSVSQALEVNMGPNVKEDVLDGLMVERITIRRAERQEDGSRFIDKFNRLIQETPQTIAVRKEISRAIRAGVISIRSGQHRFNGENLGLNQDAAVLFLLAEENSGVYRDFLDAMEQFDNSLRREVKSDLAQTQGAMKQVGKVPMGGIMSFGSDGTETKIEGSEFQPSETAATSDSQESPVSQESDGEPGSQAMSPELKDAEEKRKKLAAKAQKAVNPKAKGKSGNAGAKGNG